MSENEKTSGKVREDYLDDAAIDAIGAATAAESEQFSKAPASEEEARTARQLRETVARMAAASPYMEPSSDLKAKIMAATAPANFKMEDYKKANDDARWWRYGLVAAILFLVGAAYFNMTLQNQLKASQAQMAQLRKSIDDQNTALSMIADPKTQKGALRVSEKVTAVVLLDEEKKVAVVIGPGGAFPQGKVPQLEIAQNGNKTRYHTIPVVIGNDTGENVAEGKSIELRYLKQDDRPNTATANFLR